MEVKNQHTSIFIIILYIFCFQTPLTNIFGIFRYWDEFFALISFCAFMIFSLRNSMPLKREIISLIIFIILGIFGNVIKQYQNFLGSVLPDLFLCIKFWIVFYCGKYIVYIDHNMVDSKYIIGKHACFIISLLSILSVLNYCTNIFPTVSPRFGIKALQLFYNHPTNLVAILVCLLGIVVWTSRELKYWKLFTAFDLILMTLTFRSKAFVMILITVLLFYFILIRKKSVTVRTLLLFFPLILMVAWDQIQYYFVDISESSARLALLTTSIQIAKECFPIGVGFATFGSAYSVRPYSPVYALYGIDNIYGLRITNASFISDSFWPMVLGQTGIAGLLCIVYILFKTFKQIQGIKLFQREYLAALLIFCYLLISSTSEAAFVSPNAIPMAFILSILVYQDEIYKGDNIYE